MGLPAEARKPEGSVQADLSALLLRRHCDIEQRWLSRVTADGRVRGIDLTELRDAMPDYLTRLAESLGAAGTTEERGSEEWREIAREHGVMRIRLGFDIEQLIHEFIVLRQVICEIAREDGLIEDSRHGDRVADLVESGMAESVRAYVESRDYAARRKEAEHVGFITHELKNPLTTALLVTDQIRRRPSFPPDMRGPFDMLERSLRRIDKLIGEVLEVEQLEAGQVTAERQPSTLGELLVPLVAAARLVAEEKGLELDALFDPESSVEVDTRLTASAIQNLLENGLKFTDTGRVELRAEARRGELVVHVRAGCGGISERELRALFEPFRRGRSGKPGTGLGLAITRRAVEAQGGTIEVECALGRGCHFWFTVPSGATHADEAGGARGGADPEA